jgi:predicted branched-subunit amino acid permease
LVIGSTVATVDQPLAGWAGSWIIFGGSAHLAALQGVANGNALLGVVTGLVVNARLFVYGASMAPRWRTQPLWFRATAAAMLVDPTWALADQHAERGASSVAQRQFFFGAAFTLGAAWSALIAAGALAGDRLPHVGLELVAPLSLIALVGPRLRVRSHRWAAITAATTATVTSGWPAGTGVAVAIAAGSVAAVVTGRTAR